jgi:hypothetical protein
MSVRRSAISAAAVVFSVAIILGAVPRFIHLDWPPLSDGEANFALPALSRIADSAPFVDPAQAPAPASAVYQVLTSLVFNLFGPSDAGARLVPAFFGALLVAMPLLLRRRIGPSRAALTMLLLALSPTLVGASRLAGDAVIGAFGVSFGLAALSASWGGKSTAVMLGIGVGLALAGGPSTWFGVSGLLIGAIAFWAMGRLTGTLALPNWRPPYLRLMITVALISAVGIASGAGISFRGLSSIFSSLSNWLSGWGMTEPIRPLTLGIASLAYEPLLWFLGIAGGVLAFRKADALAQASVYWVAGELVMILIYPARQPENIIWLAIPLAFLGGLSLGSMLDALPQLDSRRAVPLLGGACLVLAAFAILQLRAEAQGRFAGLSFAGIPMGLLLPLLASLLAAALILLFGLGWSWRDARMSAGCSAALVLLALSLASLSRISFGESAGGAAELWRPSGSTAGIPLMLDSLELASQAQTGFDTLMDVQVIDGISPALTWALRAFPRPSMQDALQGIPAPAAIAPETALTPEMSEGYIGQTLTLRERWGWDGALPPNALRWLVLGDGPVVQDRWVMLIRADVFGREE